MRRYLLSIGVFLKFTLLIFLLTSHTSAQNPIARLTLNNPLENQIKSGENHFYSINLSANQTAVVEIIQNGIELELAALNPQGEKYIETNSPSGLFGKDLILVMAESTGEHKVEVKPFFSRAKLGKYTIRLKEIRPTVRRDALINGAADLIMKVAFQATALRNNGTIEGKTEAIKKWGDIVELSKLKEDVVWAGVAFGTRGVMYQEIGEFQNALDSYLLSLEIWKRLGNRQYQGSIVNNLGAIYLALAEYEKAISYFEQALIFQKESGNVYGAANTLHNLANSYSELKNYKKAENYYRQAIAIQETNKIGLGKQRLANILHSFGASLLFSGNTKEGQKYVEKALEIRKEINDNWGIANSLLIIGKAQWDSGFKDVGYKSLTESVNRSKEVGDRVMHAEGLYFLAVAEREKGNLEKAIEYIKESVSLTELIRGELVNTKSRYGYFSNTQKYFELYVDLLVSKAEKNKDEQSVFEALLISERSRSRSLLDLLEEAKVDFKKGINPKLFAELKKLQKEINSKYAIRQQKIADNESSEEITKLNNEINDLNTKIQSLNTQIRRANPKFANLTEGEIISVKEIQDLLDDKSVLLEYKLGDKRSYVWLVTKKTIEVFTLPTRKEIEKTAREFFTLVVSNKRDEEAKRIQKSKELGNLLISKFVEKISQKRLVIVADGVLQYTPFSALHIPNSKTNTLADENEIVLLPSASVLAQLRNNSKQNNSKTIAVFADPVFDSEDARIEKTPNPKTQSTQNILIKQALRDFRFGDTLPRLLASRKEAREIFNLVNKDSGSLKLGFEANLNGLENLNLSQYKYLHFATHGLINTSRPELSGLVFSLYDKNGQEQDGFLSLNDIYNLDLSSEMIVLSACQTAFGKDVEGEGLIGLSRGFLYAGSKRVVASYWKVDDFATAEFMKRFYRNHFEKGMPASKALQQTKLEMKKIRRYQSPYYWSTFTLFGDWR